MEPKNDLPKLDARDGLMFYFLSQFIKEGYPKPDAEVQVATAYYYAEVVLKFKEMEAKAKEEVADAPPQVCPKCQQPLKVMNTTTMEEGESFSMICLNPSCRYVWEQPKTNKVN